MPSTLRNLNKTRIMNDKIFETGQAHEEERGGEGRLGDVHHHGQAQPQAGDPADGAREHGRHGGRDETPVRRLHPGDGRHTVARPDGQAAADAGRTAGGVALEGPPRADSEEDGESAGDT